MGGSRMATFAAFEAHPDLGHSQRLLWSTVVAFLFLGAGAFGIYRLIGSGGWGSAEEKQVDVLLQPPAPEPEPEPPPPPPPPKPIAKPIVAEPSAPPPVEALPPPSPKPTGGPTGGTSGIAVGRTGGGD